MIMNKKEEERVEVNNDLNEEDWEIVNANDQPEPQEGAIQDAAEGNNELNEDDWEIIDRNNQPAPQVGAIQEAAGENAGADPAAQNQNVEGAGHQNDQNITLDDVEEGALQTWEVVSAQNHDPEEEQEAAPDPAFDRPDEEPATGAMPHAVLGGGTNLDKLVLLKARVNERRNSDIYKAVCVARLLNHNQRNPLAGHTRTSLLSKTKYWGEKTWDSIVDVSNMVAGADTIYGNFLSENKKTKNGISAVTNSIAFINSTINACRKIKHLFQNFKNHKVLTLDNTLEVFGLVGDACMMAAKAGNIIKSVYTLTGAQAKPWVKKWSKASYFLTGSSQFLSLGITSTNLFRKGLKIREFEKNASLFEAKQAAVRVINAKRRPDEPELGEGHVSEGGSSDLACQARAKALLKRNARTRQMMESGPLRQNTQEEGQHEENAEAPAGAGQANVQLSDDDINALVTYVALRGKVEDAELSLLKSVPGIIAGATGMLSSFWGGTNAQLNEAGTNKSMNTATKAFSTVSSAAALGNSGYRMVQRGLDIKKDLTNPAPGGEANNLTANFIWNRFEQIITNDAYGLKGLDREIREQGAAIADPHHPNEAENHNYTALENRVLDAFDRYDQLNTSIGKLFVPIDKLIAAEDITAFKKLLVVSGL